MNKLFKIFLASYLLATSTLSYADKTAPDFTLPAKNGSITLSKYKGRVVYLDFWASWCIPCRKSFPWMNAMQKNYSKSLVVITINLDKKKKAVDKFLTKYPANFIVAHDPAGKTAELYDVKGMPSSYIIDRDGKIVYSHIGFREKSKKELEKKIQEAVVK